MAERIDDIGTIGVVGAGQMGTGIAQLCVTAGYGVVLIDIDAERLDQAAGTIGRHLRRRSIEVPFHTATDLAAATGCDLAIEAATEDEGIKKAILKDLCAVLSKDAVIATNTSAISITRLAAATDCPERVIGMHFMNPVTAMDLIEVTSGITTDPATAELIRALAVKLGKTPVIAGDFPAFIVNRILLPMINEAAYVLHEGVGTVEAVDTALKLGAKHPMGPLQLADFIGLDTCLAILSVLHEELADSKYRPCPLLVKYVEAGWLGRKSGRGFYRYDQG